ncbi:MAG TPA: hypothetical protein VJ853_12190 [Thermoanaerobaculia bacterium]|nr:hypothetical protein [Thermoanaerobaculia bacterium]
MVARLTLLTLLVAACNGAEPPVGNPARIGLKMTDATMTDSGDRIAITMRLQLLGVPKRVTRIRLEVNGESIVVRPDVQAVDVHFDVAPPPPSAVNVVAFVTSADGGEQRQDFRFTFPWADNLSRGERSPRSGG